MGVSGLLPLLKSIHKSTDLKSYNGLTLGVDGYGWLHRAAHSCAVELGQGKPTTRYIAGVMHKVRMLRHFGVTPYMVFDGGYLPSKAATEESREKSRDTKKKLALELLKSGKTAQAQQEFQKCIDITPEMASALIQQLKKMDIPYVVAPYEADSQLVYLEKQGLIHGIISEDSDLLVFGAKTLLTKLDQYGNCIEIKRKDFCRCREISLTGWSDTEFRRMAIMSGCDYLDGLPSVGLKTAYRMLRKTKEPERVVKMLQFQGKKVSENYLTQFYQAELTFLHQWVFCPNKQEIVNLTEIENGRTALDMPFIGPYIETEKARAIAKGDLNPITGLPIRHPSTPTKRRHSQMGTPAAQPAKPVNPINSYFNGGSRIPMGNMDPNCFNIDKQRVAQLTNNGLVPRVFPLPRPYLEEPASSSTSARDSQPSATRTSPRLHRRRTEPIGAILSRVASQGASQRSVSSEQFSAIQLPKTDAAAARPSKKVRLCDDAELDDISPKKSKFFGGGSTTTTAKRTTARAKSDAHLLRSDDSLEDALANLPDVEGWKAEAKVAKPLKVYDDSAEQASAPVSQATVDVGTSQETSQDTLLDSMISTQTSDIIKSTPPSSPESMMPPPKALSTTRRVASTQAPKTPALHQYSYSSSSTISSSASSRRSSSVFSAVATPSTAPSTGPASRLTPLQRLGAKAMNVSPKPSSQPVKPKRKSWLNNLPVNPAMVALPKVDLKEVEALNRGAEGSEDLIIPDSEGEEEEEEVGLSRRKLDLSRFAYA